MFHAFIASPGDVQEERLSAVEAIGSWNNVHSKALKLVLLPVRWETHMTPRTGDRPQSMINELLADSDILIGIFGGTLGTSKGDHEPGAVEEVRVFSERSKWAMLYFKQFGGSVLPTGPEGDEQKRVNEYRETHRRDAWVQSYNNAEKLKELLKEDLSKAMYKIAGLVLPEKPDEDFQLTAPDPAYQLIRRGKTYFVLDSKTRTARTATQPPSVKAAELGGAEYDPLTDAWTTTALHMGIGGIDTDFS